MVGPFTTPKRVPLKKDRPIWVRFFFCDAQTDGRPTGAGQGAIPAMPALLQRPKSVEGPWGADHGASRDPPDPPPP